MTAVLAAFIISWAFNFFHAKSNPVVIGQILAAIGFTAYTGSAIAYYIAGKHYIAFKRNSKYRSFLTFNRSKRGYDS